MTDPLPYSLTDLLRLFVFLALIAVAPVARSGAWTPEKGKTYLKISANSFTSFANYDTNGDIVDPFAELPDQFSRFTDDNLFVYFETGLRDNLALYGSATYKEIEQLSALSFGEVGVDNSGLGDVELGLRYRLTEGPDIWSVALLAKLPYLYDEDEFFALGNGQEDIELRGLYGRSLGKGFYMGLEAGYRLRLDDPSDEIRYLAELGWSFRQFYVRAKLDGIDAIDSFEPVPPGGNPLLNPQYDLTSLETTGGYAINDTWHLEYTYTDTLSGKNTAEGYNTQVALVLTF